MRVTGFWALAGAVVFGLIIADIWIHPKGTAAAGNVLIQSEKTTTAGLLGK